MYAKGFRKSLPKDPVEAEDKTPVFINQDTKNLIIGTMISYDGRFVDGKYGNGNFDFFYPNEAKNHLWSFLFKVFDSTPKDLSEYKKRSRIEKEQFLIRNNIGMTNLISKCICKKNCSYDSQIMITKIKNEIPKKILNSNLQKIFFTSKNTFSLFLNLPNIEISCKEDIVTLKTNIMFPLIINGRKFTAFILPNPTSRGRFKGDTLENKYFEYKKMLIA